MGKGKRSARIRGKSDGKISASSPFRRPCIGTFTDTDIEIAADLALKGVEKGAELTRRALEEKPIAKWVIFAYFLILTFAIAIILLPLVFPGLSELSNYGKIAIGYIFGQIPLLMKSKLKGD